jgi:hypothetical protein
MSKSAYIKFGGGLDLVTPERQMGPGTLFTAVNYECPVTGGYRRVQGYAQIGPQVPGTGPVLGVYTFYDRYYAIREDLAGTTATLYRLSVDETMWELMGSGSELNAGRHEFDEGNPYATDAGTALYGVGGGKPFELQQDGTLTVLANAPTGATMIALHQNHLFLGIRAGSLQHSNIGDPAGWDAATGGAGEIGVGQTLTDLVKGIGGVLHIGTRDSIQTLRGTSSANFALETTVPGVGVRPFSAQSQMTPYFVTERGITTLQASQQYGDFTPMQPGRFVEPLFSRDGLADRVVCSSISRRKAQYRVFFDNGTILLVSPGGITQAVIDHQASVASSNELSTGEEVLLMGDTQGCVFRMDFGNTFNGSPIKAFLTSAFTDLKSSATRKRFRRAFFDVRSGSQARIWVQPDFDYGSTETSMPRRAPIDYKLGGGFWGADNWNDFRWSVPVMGEEAIDVTGSGTSINFAIFSEDSSEPHEILGYDLYFDIRRNRRG